MVNVIAPNNTIYFRERTARQKPAVALVYDIADFSRFANRPNAPRYVPRFINHVSSALDTVIYGGSPYWTDEADVDYEALPRPVHQKFLGDGALFIWVASSERQLLRSPFVLELCDRLRELGRHFDRVVQLASHDVPIASIPNRIRFGLAMGDVTEVARRDVRQREYVGTCINLASRLQNYCPGIGFAASASVGMNRISGEARGYMWVTAKRVKGFPSEVVIVDRSEYEATRPGTRAASFEEN